MIWYVVVSLGEAEAVPGIKVIDSKEPTRAHKNFFMRVTYVTAKCHQARNS